MSVNLAMINIFSLTINVKHVIKTVKHAQMVV